MIAEELEFQISQYVDGTLSVDDRQLVEAALSADPRARKLLADYRRLDLEIARSHSCPQVDWDQLAEHVSGEIDNAQDATVLRPAIAERIVRWSAWSPRLRIAAALLIVSSIWIFTRHHSPPTDVPLTHLPVSTSVVTGPTAEVATGPAVEDVQVKPSAYAARNDATRYGDGVIVGSPPKVIISGLTPSNKHYSHLH